MLGADCEAATALGAVIDGSPPTPSAVVGRCWALSKHRHRHMFKTDLLST